MIQTLAKHTCGITWSNSIGSYKYVYSRGCSFNCGTEVLQGTLKDFYIFHSFQPDGVFFRDRNSVSSIEIQALNVDQ